MLEDTRKTRALALVARGFNPTGQPLKTNTCGHPERRHYGHGMCERCYNKARWQEGKIKNDLIKPQINFYCSLCGDGIVEVTRGCKLHLDICNVCHHEYCECQVESKVELLALEAIVKEPEDDRIPLLKARKMTLRLAGKITNSLPPLGG